MDGVRPYVTSDTDEDRCLRTGASGRRASTRLQPAGSERQDLDTAVHHGTEWSDARLREIGELVTLLPHAAGRAAREGR